MDIGWIHRECFAGDKVKYLNVYLNKAKYIIFIYTSIGDININIVPKFGYFLRFSIEISKAHSQGRCQIPNGLATLLEAIHLSLIKGWLEKAGMVMFMKYVCVFLR